MLILTCSGSLFQTWAEHAAVNPDTKKQKRDTWAPWYEKTNAEDAGALVASHAKENDGLETRVTMPRPRG